VYLQQVINETLRCSQLAPFAARVKDTDEIIGGHEIAAGTPVILALGCLHHREDLWPEPTKFDPDRFSEENMRHKPRYSFLPFGGTGRKCPGCRLAMTEAVSVLSVLVRKFEFDLVPGQEVTPMLGLVTQPADEIWLTVKKRN